jgi:hypothetical protein
MYEVELRRTRTGKTTTRKCATLRKCAEVVRTYIESKNLGPRGFSGGSVTKSGTEVANVSYNGRVWQPGQFPTPEITDLDR